MSSSEETTRRPSATAASGGDTVSSGGSISDGPVHTQALSVIDGDTIEVRYGDRRQKVRLLGIDAPERTTLRTGRTECGGQQATRALYEVMDEERNVVLEADPTQATYDKYGRLLAYVTAEGATRTWQERLLAEGWAQVYSLRRNPIERLDEFSAAAAQAKEEGVGVWAQCNGDFRSSR